MDKGQYLKSALILGGFTRLHLYSRGEITNGHYGLNQDIRMFMSVKFAIFLINKKVPIGNLLLQNTKVHSHLSP